VDKISQRTNDCIHGPEPNLEVLHETLSEVQGWQIPTLLGVDLGEIADPRAGNVQILLLDRPVGRVPGPAVARLGIGLVAVVAVVDLLDLVIPEGDALPADAEGGGRHTEVDHPLLVPQHGADPVGGADDVEYAKHGHVQLLDQGGEVIGAEAEV